LEFPGQMLCPAPLGVGAIFSSLTHAVAIWVQLLSVRVPGCQKLQKTA